MGLVGHPARGTVWWQAPPHLQPAGVGLHLGVQVEVRVAELAAGEDVANAVLGLR